MPARSIWKAELQLGDLRVPVQLYAAIEDRSVHFRLLHARDHAPVAQQLIDPVDGRPVAADKVRRGVEIEEGRFVVLTEDERHELEPKPSRQIRVAQLLAPSAIDSRWLDRPYYLGPDGDDAPYFALAQALAKRDRVGIAQWTMRKRRYEGALFARSGYLVLQTVRHTGELVALERIARDDARKPARTEEKLAEQLIETLAGPFDPAAFRDTYRARVEALIRAKSEGRSLPRRHDRAKPVTGALADQLRASLRRKEAKHA